MAQKESSTRGLRVVLLIVMAISVFGAVYDTMTEGVKVMSWVPLLVVGTGLVALIALPPARHPVAKKSPGYIIGLIAVLVVVLMYGIDFIRGLIAGAGSVPSH